MNNSVRTTAMTIRIEADLLNALKKVCNDNGYSQSFVVRELLKDYVKNNAQKELFDFEGVEFEKPPIKLTSKEIVQAMFNKGHKYVPCWVSIDTEQPDNTSVWAFVKEINDDGWFVDQSNLDWRYVTPFNQTTGEAITELPT